MDANSRIHVIIRLLKQEYLQATTALNYKNSLELLIATMLSAQCTDERVNQVTQVLFKKYKTVEDYANADLKTLQGYVRPTGFYRNKAKNIKNACEMIIEKFESKVPNNMNGLVKLPGVARKTANIVLSNYFGVVVGIAVDTHVKRLTQRFGLTENKVADKIEKDLMRIVPKPEWFSFSNLLIQHGRKICKSRKPLCSDCVLKNLCPSSSSFQ